MSSESLKKASEWAQFGLGLLLGISLAFIIYAGLQPRLEKAVQNQEQALRDQQAAKAKTQQQAALTTAAATAEAKATLNSLKKAPGTANSTTRTDTPQIAPKPAATSRAKLTPTSLPADAPGRGPGLAVGLVLLVMATSLVAGVAAWRQYRQEPQPPGAITSPVLEALFTLATHRHMLQQELGLSPRQIKRFSSKARVQHSQLRALLKPLDESLPNAFSIENQLKAFQMLLLLEANRRQPKPLPAENAAEFISQLQAAYYANNSLAQARLEAFQHPVVAQAISREGLTFTPTFEDEERFMRQLYEMNAGLLA